MVYWHEDAGAAAAGKHRSAVCSETEQKRGGENQADVEANTSTTAKREPRGALTLLGPGPPKAEGDEGDDDEDEGSQDDANYEVGEVAGPRHQSAGAFEPGIRGLRRCGPMVIRTS